MRMAVFLTGDIHGELDIAKVDDFSRGDGQALTRDDYLIILGDFGLVWTDPPSEGEAARLDWLEAQPWTTLFVDGNHENFDLLDALPVEKWAGGRVHRVREHVLHLLRGEAFVIDGLTFFVVGGAYSIDREWRTPHRTWWPQEVPSAEERAYVDRRVRELGSVDYVLTHCPPTGCYRRYRARWSGFWGPSDEWTDWLEEHVEGRLRYRRWFYGHLHFDLPDDKPHTLLFNHVLRLPEA